MADTKKQVEDAAKQTLDQAKKAVADTKKQVEDAAKQTLDQAKKAVDDTKKQAEQALADTKKQAEDAVKSTVDQAKKAATETKESAEKAVTQTKEAAVKAVDTQSKALQSAFKSGAPPTTDDDLAVAEVVEGGPTALAIQKFSVFQQIVPAKQEFRAFDFTKPATPIFGSYDGPSNAGGGRVYNYPAYYDVKAEVDQWTKTAMNASSALQNLVEGVSTVPAFLPGFSFKPSGAVSESLQKDYVLYEVVHDLKVTKDGAGESDESGQPQELYTNTFKAFAKNLQFNPPQVTPTPKISSVQTATVTGPKDNQVYVDQYGRIKVQFHWDLLQPADENSSCWVRVASPWAGSGWGFISTPRVGMEVVVSFLEGNPDKPLIVGCVYNGSNMPPYRPDEFTRSTWKTNTITTPEQEAGGYNEFTLDDTYNKEQIYFHAQKDMVCYVQNDWEQTNVGGGINIYLTAAKEEQESGKGGTTAGGKGITSKTDDGSSGGSGGSESMVEGAAEENLPSSGSGDSGPGPGFFNMKMTHGDYALTMDKGSKTITLTKGDRSITLTEGNQSLTLTKGNRTIELKEGNDSTTLTKVNQTITLDEGNQTTKLTKGDMSVTLSKGDLTYDVTGDITIKCSGDMKLNAGGNISMQSGKDYKLQVGGGLTEDVTGKASVTIGGSLSETIAGSASSTYSSTWSVTSSSSISVTSGAAMTVTAGGAYSVEASGAASVSAGGAWSVEASTAAITASAISLA